MKHFLFSLLLFFTAFLYAQTVTIEVNGHGERENVYVPLSFEWHESFFENSNLEYNHNIARCAAVLSALAYTERGGASGDRLIEAYRKLGFASENIETFYELDYTDGVFGIDQCALSLAVKKTRDGKDLLFLVIRGTPDGANEWLSNLNVGDTDKKGGEYHEGFYRAVVQLEMVLSDFTERRGINLKESRILITGHSRGAAIANLFSALLIDHNTVDENSIWTYTFAAPNVTTRPDAENPRYDFIWNILNGEDLVPVVPPNDRKWTYTKFGRRRVLVGSWNCENRKVYEDDFIPRMNDIYRQLSGRDYCPFASGSFMGRETAHAMSWLNNSPEKYYRGFFPLRKKLGNAVENMFQEEPVKKKNSSGGFRRVFESFKKKADTRTKIFIEYSLNAFLDMHVMQSYLSWIFALDEKDLFAEKESSIVVLKGNFNGAVVDEKGEVFAKITDGVLALRETRRPVASWQIPIGNFGPIALGFPCDKNYSLLIYKDSIVPTPISVTIERYAGDGKFLGTISRKIAGAHSGIVYSFAAGGSVLEQENESAPDYEKLKKQAAKTAIKDGRLKSTDVAHTNFELHFDTDGFMEFGVTSGLQKLYAAMLFGFDMGDAKNTQVFSMGVGTQHAFCGPFMLNAEAFLKFAHYRYESEQDSWRFTLVPAARFLLSIKPAKRFQFFTGVEFNAYIKNMNGDIFDNGYRSGGMGPIDFSDSFALYPAMQFGVKL